MAQDEPTLHITWPLYDEDSAEPLAVDPSRAMHACAPVSGELEQLQARTDLPETAPRSPEPVRKVASGTLPPGAPEWMQAARALSQKLEATIARGSVDASEHAAIARAWAAWSLGGMSPEHILRVAHLVSRAHAALRDVRAVGAELEAAYRDAAGVLHTGLPSVIRKRMPFERMGAIVRQLRREADPWAAVVEISSELLGWKDYARLAAAAAIRSIIEQSH